MTRALEDAKAECVRLGVKFGTTTTDRVEAKDATTEGTALRNKESVPWEKNLSNVKTRNRKNFKASVAMNKIAREVIHLEINRESRMMSGRKARTHSARPKMARARGSSSRTPKAC